MNKLTLIIFFINFINLKAQDFQHDYFERDTIIKYGIDIIRVENTCISNTFLTFFTDGQTYCDLKTNTQEYFFNPLGKLDSAKFKNKYDKPYFKEINRYDDKGRLMQVTTYRGADEEDVTKVVYNYNEKNRKIQEINTRSVLDEMVLLDTIQYEWRCDTSIKYSVINGEPVGTVLFSIYNSEELETLTGEYDWEKQQIKHITAEKIYAGKELIEEIIYDITEVTSTHTYYSYERDSQGRIKSKTKVIDDGVDAVLREYKFNGNVLFEMIETEKLTGDVFKSTYYYILNN